MRTLAHFGTAGILIDACSQTMPDNGEAAAFVEDWGGNDAEGIAAQHAKGRDRMIRNSPVMSVSGAIAKGIKYAFDDPGRSLGWSRRLSAKFPATSE